MLRNPAVQTLRLINKTVRCPPGLIFALKSVSPEGPGVDNRFVLLRDRGDNAERGPGGPGGDISLRVGEHFHPHVFGDGVFSGGRSAVLEGVPLWTVPLLDILRFKNNCAGKWRG